MPRAARRRAKTWSQARCASDRFLPREFGERPLPHWNANQHWLKIRFLHTQKKGTATAYRIGRWVFEPQSGELRSNGETRRLEPRAAQALELLCEARGQVVTNQQLIDRVWSGRTVSENSISIVIGQLRRALDDDSRSVIENVPKRGYRLSSAGPLERKRVRRPAFAAFAALLFALAAAFAVVLALNSSDPVVAVRDVANETGDSGYSAHARATSELLVHELRERGFSVRRDASGADYLLVPRLVIWDGKPFLGLTATSPDGAVHWSAVIPGSPAEVPGTAARALDEFKDQSTAS